MDLENLTNFFVRNSYHPEEFHFPFQASMLSPKFTVGEVVKEQIHSLDEKEQAVWRAIVAGKSYERIAREENLEDWRVRKITAGEEDNSAPGLKGKLGIADDSDMRVALQASYFWNLPEQISKNNGNIIGILPSASIIEDISRYKNLSYIWAMRSLGYRFDDMLEKLGFENQRSVLLYKEDLLLKLNGVFRKECRELELEPKLIISGLFWQLAWQSPHFLTNLAYFNKV